jgi:hypothetical protein
MAHLSEHFSELDIVAILLPFVLAVLSCVIAFPL